MRRKAAVAWVYGIKEAYPMSSPEYDKIRKSNGLFNKYVQTYLYHTEGGDLALLLALRDPDKPGVAGDTIGSAKISDHEAIRALVRGVECGMVAMLRWEHKS